jgi:hypothetical protein
MGARAMKLAVVGLLVCIVAGISLWVGRDRTPDLPPITPYDVSTTTTPPVPREKFTIPGETAKSDYTCNYQTKWKCEITVPTEPSEVIVDGHTNG